MQRLPCRHGVPRRQRDGVQRMPAWGAGGGQQQLLLRLPAGKLRFGERERRLHLLRYWHGVGVQRSGAVHSVCTQHLRQPDGAGRLRRLRKRDDGGQHGRCGVRAVHVPRWQLHLGRAAVHGVCGRHVVARRRCDKLHRVRGRLQSTSQQLAVRGLRAGLLWLQQLLHPMQPRERGVRLRRAQLRAVCGEHLRRRHRAAQLHRVPLGHGGAARRLCVHAGAMPGRELRQRHSLRGVRAGHLLRRG